jgi:hypothetical protein
MNDWAERRHLHPEDERLRRHGFRIVKRPRKGPTLWARPREVAVPHEDALAVCDQEDALADAHAAQNRVADDSQLL